MILILVIDWHAGMTRYTDHLDDMPARGYARSAMRLRRAERGR